MKTEKVNSLYNYCREYHRADLLEQWHSIKNGSITPFNVWMGSHYKAWWRCKRGHEWQTQVKHRTAGAGCPYCTNRRVLHGENDLATTHPDLARQWHPTLNGTLTVEMVTPGSNKKVWWQCPNGHVWKAVICSRAGRRRCGCPVCSGRIRPEHMRRYAVTPSRALQP